MTTKTTVPISTARNNLFQIAEEVQTPGVYYTLTAKGKPSVVMLAAEEFEALQETVEVMRDIPDVLQDIQETEEDLKSGVYKQYHSLEDVKF